MRRILPHVGLGVFSLYILLPFAWALRTSFVPEKLAYAPAIFPSITIDNYISIMNRGFGGALINSVLLAGGATLLALPFSALVAYAFVRFNTGGRKARFLVLATQMLPAVVLVLPVFTIFRSVGMTNSLTGLIIVYASLNLPFLTWILLGFFEGIPSDLESAAMTDGATPLQAFLLIVLPLAAPGLVSAGILCFIMTWNEFIFALVLGGPKSTTVPVALAAFQSSNGIQIASVAAGVAIAVIPLAVISRFVQRFIVRGLTLGAVK